jgi:hypothetical protein
MPERRCHVKMKSLTCLVTMIAISRAFESPGDFYAAFTTTDPGEKNTKNST